VKEKEVAHTSESVQTLSARGSHIKVEFFLIAAVQACCVFTDRILVNRMHILWDYSQNHYRHLQV
jgi:hypothetical protein